MKKIKNNGLNTALIFGGSLVGVVALSLVIAKKANIDPIYVALVAPILALPIGSSLMSALLEPENEMVSNATGSVRQVKGRFP